MGVSSTPTLVFGALHTSEIDSIIITNTTNNPLIADITILREVEPALIKDAMRDMNERYSFWGKHVQVADPIPVTSYIAKQVPIVRYGKQEIVNLSINEEGISHTPTILYLNTGDIIFASSDFVNNLFDCTVCYREFSEQ